MDWGWDFRDTRFLPGCQAQGLGLASNVLCLSTLSQDPMMSKALQCLHKSSNTTDIYTQALLAYSFGLAGDMQLWSALLKSLAQYSTSSGTVYSACWSPLG